MRKDTFRVPQQGRLHTSAPQAVTQRSKGRASQSIQALKGRYVCKCKPDLTELPRSGATSAPDSRAKAKTVVANAAANFIVVCLMMSRILDDVRVHFGFLWRQSDRWRDDMTRRDDARFGQQPAQVWVLLPARLGARCAGRKPKSGLRNTRASLLHSVATHHTFALCGALPTSANRVS